MDVCFKERSDNMNEMNKTIESEYDQKVILDHQLEEWKILNEYLNSMDTGYQQSITIVVSIFAVVATVLSQSDNPQWQWGIFIIPLGMVAFFSYISYQFRVTAILRGHLAALEESMNKRIHENVHMWNSALVETFMAHNNLINRMMMMPIMIFLFLVVIYCIKMTYYLLLIKNGGINFGIVLFVLYWIVIFLCSLIDFIPFMNNEKVRYETFNENIVMENYYNYKTAMQLKQSNYECKKKKSFFKYEPMLKKDTIDIETLKNAICLAIGVCVLGFGVLNVFWINYSGDKTLNGLYDYYAATIGDGICLPLLIAAGYYFATVNKWKEHIKIKQFGRDERIVDIMGKIFVVIAILIQGSWLIKDSTELNWTIDRVHHFNLAGWYHAIYFVIMFWVITRTFSKALILNTKKGGKILGKNSYILMWISASGYFYMHIIDDWLTKENYMFLIIASTIIMLILYCSFEYYAEIKYPIQNDKINKFNLYENEGHKRYVQSCTIYIVVVIIMAILVCCYCIIGGLEWNILEMFEKIIQILK